jgi:hypothetical protein
MKAEAAALRLGLAFDYRLTSYGELEGFIDGALKSGQKPADTGAESTPWRS